MDVFVSTYVMVKFIQIIPMSIDHSFCLGNQLDAPREQLSDLPCSDWTNPSFMGPSVWASYGKHPRIWGARELFCVSQEKWS